MGSASHQPSASAEAGYTVDSLLALGMPHKLEAKGAMQFAVPIQDENTYYSGDSDDGPGEGAGDGEDGG